MTKEEFIKGKINSTNNSISGARAQLVVDAAKPTVSRSLIRLIEQGRANLVRYELGVLNEGEEFHLETINS